MNAVRGAAPQSDNQVSGQPLAQRAYAKGCVKSGVTDPRQAIADRYPAGLISDDELAALLGLAKS